MTREEISYNYYPLIKELVNNSWYSKNISIEQAIDLIELAIKRNKANGMTIASIRERLESIKREEIYRKSQ